MKMDWTEADFETHEKAHCSRSRKCTYRHLKIAEHQIKIVACLAHGRESIQSGTTIDRRFDHVTAFAQNLRRHVENKDRVLDCEKQ